MTAEFEMNIANTAAVIKFETLLGWLSGQFICILGVVIAANHLACGEFSDERKFVRSRFETVRQMCSRSRARFSFNEKIGGAVIEYDIRHRLVVFSFTSICDSSCDT